MERIELHFKETHDMDTLFPLNIEDLLSFITNNHNALEEMSGLCKECK